MSDKDGLIPEEFGESLRAELERLSRQDDRAERRAHLYAELSRLDDEEREEHLQRLKTLEVTSKITYDPATRKVVIEQNGNPFHTFIPKTRCGQNYIPDENDILVAAIFALLPLIEKFANEETASMIDAYSAERLFKLVSWKEEADYIESIKEGE
jgi:hypothetical protein